MHLGQGAWVLPSLPAPSLLSHSSYAAMIGQEPSLKCTFPRAAGAREGSPITINTAGPGLLWVALLIPETVLGWEGGLSPQALVLTGPSGSCSSPGFGEGHRRSSQPPAPQQPESIFGSRECGFVFEIPVQQEFVFIAREMQFRWGFWGKGYTGARVNEHQERGTGPSVRQSICQGHWGDGLGSDALSAAGIISLHGQKVLLRSL